MELDEGGGEEDLAEGEEGGGEEEEDETRDGAFVFVLVVGFLFRGRGEEVGESAGEEAGEGAGEGNNGNVGGGRV